MAEGRSSPAKELSARLPGRGDPPGPRLRLTALVKNGEHILRTRLRVSSQVANFQAFSGFCSVAALVWALTAAPSMAQSPSSRPVESTRAPTAQPASRSDSKGATPPAAGQAPAKSAAGAASKGAGAKKSRNAKNAKQDKPRAFEDSPKPAQPGRAAAATAAVVGAAAAGSAAAAAQPPARPSVGESIGLKRVPDPLSLHSSVALVMDARSGDVLVRKNPGAVLPIASITKLMTAMVVLDAELPLAERLQITRDDIDRLRGTSSRLHPGAWLTRAEMLQLSLMASENRAANALGRHYPGGMPAFVAAMNAKARSLGLRDTRFVEPTGLSSSNVSSGGDLAQLVRAASSYPLIRQYSVARSLTVQPAREPLGYYNTNRLVSTAGWSIGLQKTGFISEAGNCLVMIANIEGRPLIVVLLDAAGKLARFGDAQRIRSWVEKAGPPAHRIHADSGQGESPAPLRVSLGAQ